MSRPSAQPARLETSRMFFITRRNAALTRSVCDPLHGGAGGHTAEFGHSGVLSALVPGRKSEEVGVDGLHAEVAHDSQCDAEEWNAVAGSGQSVGLIFKTVADPLYCSSA